MGEVGVIVRSDHLSQEGQLMVEGTHVGLPCSPGPVASVDLHSPHSLNVRLQAVLDSRPCTSVTETLPCSITLPGNSMTYRDLAISFDYHSRASTLERGVVKDVSR